MSRNQRIRAAIFSMPISTKILGICVLSSLATLIAFCSITFYLDWIRFKDRKISELKTFATILDSNTAAAIRFNDPYTAKEYVDSLRHDEDLRSVCVYDSHGNPFAFFGRDSDFIPYPSPHFTGPRWQATRLFYGREIIIDQAVVGSILLELDTHTLDSAIQQSLWTSIGLLLGGLALTALLASRLQRHITDPIDELVSVTKSITERKDFTTFAMKRFDDEIGSLVDSFNNMLLTLSKQDAELRANNSNLERIVRERTVDLSQRNEALKNAMEAARAAAVAKGEFLAVASHELRTPLNPIIGYVDLLLQEKPNEECARKLNLIRQSARLLLRLIDDILDFSRLEHGNLRLEPNVFDFRTQFSQMVDSMTSLAQEKNLSLTYKHGEEDTPSDEIPFIVADEVRIRQVMLNLIGNAIKFTSKGSIRVTSHLLIHPDQTERKALLSVEVADTGIGISSDDMEKLFKPFSQIDGSWTRERGGMGLGLAISSRIIKAMNGSITCKSEKGKGSAFSFEIPVATRERDGFDNDDIGGDTDNALDVLLVEDEPVNRELMSALLISMGHDVVTATDGIDAMTRFAEKKFHVVLLDISMPRMDGFATARAIREREPSGERIPIIAMTAHVSPDDMKRCHQAGMDDYLSKPLNFSKLRATLQKWYYDRHPNATG